MSRYYVRSIVLVTMFATACSPRPTPTPSSSQRVPAALPETLEALVQAADTNDTAKMTALLAENPALVKATTNEQETALHQVAIRDTKEVAELLLANGADVNARNKYGETPLHLAAWGDNAPVAELLLATGADIHATARDSTVMLRETSFVGKATHVTTVLIRGSDRSASGVAGITPLHWAAANNSQDVALLLLAEGANADAQDTKRMTPFDWAERLRHREVAALLNPKSRPDPQIIKALTKLREVDRAYAEYQLAKNGSTAQVDSISIRVVGGLEYFTKYSAGRVAAVKLSGEERDAARLLLDKHIETAMRYYEQASEAEWELLVVCERGTGARLGGGAIWRRIGTSPSEAALREGHGVYIGHGDLVPLVNGSLYLLNTKNKELHDYAEVYGTGTSVDTALRDFARNASKEHDELLRAHELR